MLTTMHMLTSMLRLDLSLTKVGDTVIRQDIKRAFCSLSFIGVIGLYLALMLNEAWYDYVNSLDGSLDTVWYLEYVSSVSFLLLILPVLAGIPFATSFVADWKNSYMRTICFRTTPLKYCLSKVVVTFLSGGAALAMATALFIAFFAIQPEIYMVNPNEIPYYVMNGGLTGLTIYGVKGALLFFACRILLIFMYGGMNALFTLAVSAFCLNSYIALCIPFVFSRVWIHLIGRYDWPGYFNIAQMSKGYIALSNGDFLTSSETMVIATVIYMTLSVTLGLIFIYKVGRRFANA